MRKPQAALTLIRHAIAIDDQDAFDLMSEVIEENRLYYGNADDGTPIDTMEDFLQAILSESPGKCACIAASLHSQQSRRPTPDERHAQRLENIRAGRV